MLAELMTLTKGNSLSIPSVAARAVFPLPDGPSSRHVSRSVRSLFCTYAQTSVPFQPRGSLKFQILHTHALQGVRKACLKCEKGRVFQNQLTAAEMLQSNHLHVHS